MVMNEAEVMNSNYRCTAELNGTRPVILSEMNKFDLLD